jgi:hypothetical protein
MESTTSMTTPPEEVENLMKVMKILDFNLHLHFLFVNIYFLLVLFLTLYFVDGG